MAAPGSVLTAPGSFWQLLAGPGSFWQLLATSGSFWTALRTHLGQCDLCNGNRGWMGLRQPLWDRRHGGKARSMRIFTPSLNTISYEYLNSIMTDNHFSVKSLTPSQTYDFS